MKRLQTKLTRNGLIAFLVGVSMLFILPVTAFAGSQAVPNSFSSGQQASASAVNANFSHFRTRAFDLSGSNIYYNQGYVGIYTNNPLDPLHVKADSLGDNIHLEEYSGGEDWQIGVDSTGDLNFEDEGIIRVTFEDGGYVGIGDPTPDYQLDVENMTAMTYTGNFHSSNGSDYLRVRLTGSSYAVLGQASADGDYGGLFESYGDYGYGVYGYNNGAQGWGVRGYGRKYGVYGYSADAPDAGTSYYPAGVFGISAAQNGYGVHGVANQNYGYGVYGENTASYGYGIYGKGKYGVYGIAEPANTTAYALYGYANNTAGTGSTYGTYGAAYSASGYTSYGVRGYANSPSVAYGGYFYSSGAGTTYGVRGSGSTYDFYAAGSGTNYAPFTGAHEVKLAAAFPEEAKPGMIVSVTGEVQKRETRSGGISISSTLPTVRLSDRSHDKAIFGVLVSEVTLPEDHWYVGSEGERFASVNALGEGRVWVSNIKGDIEAGDYITTSVIPGYGQLQDDDLMHSYTLGKATETVDWDSVSETFEIDGKIYKVYLIAVVYTSG